MKLIRLLQCKQPQRKQPQRKQPQQQAAFIAHYLVGFTCPLTDSSVVDCTLADCDGIGGNKEVRWNLRSLTVTLLEGTTR